MVIEENSPIKRKIHDTSITIGKKMKGQEGIPISTTQEMNNDTKNKSKFIE